MYPCISLPQCCYIPRPSNCWHYYTILSSFFFFCCVSSSLPKTHHSNKWRHWYTIAQLNHPFVCYISFFVSLHQRQQQQQQQQKISSSIFHTWKTNDLCLVTKSNTFFFFNLNSNFLVVFSFFLFLIHFHIFSCSDLLL